MKLLNIAILSFVIILNSLNADELSDAYTKEYKFLKAQKNELEYRLKKENKQQNIELAKAKKQINSLQDRYVSLDYIKTIRGVGYLLA